jgi:outer membrane lipopolysaccharide assembly protein LptE/RlpB
MRRLFALGVGAILLAACGYSLVGRASNLPPTVKSIYLQPLENKTTRTQVDQLLTRALADELVTRQRFTLLNKLEGADAELLGAVVGFGVSPVSFDPQGRATQYEIVITASMQLKQLAPEKVLWKNDHYTFRDSYQLDVSEVGYFDRETIAIERVSKKFAETMVTDLLEGF